MSFRDVIKSSILESVESSSLTTAQIAVTLGFCIVFGLYLYAVYRASQRNGFYDKQFGIVLGILPVITAGIILAMQSNLLISLGMVGALSIVRFRTAIKEAKDLLFLFWSISVGIILGAQNYLLAVYVCLTVTILLLLLELIPAGRESVLLVVNLDRDGREEEVLETAGHYSRSLRVKSRNRTTEGLDLIVECRTKQESELLNDTAALEHVVNASVVARDGEAVY